MAPEIITPRDKLNTASYIRSVANRGIGVNVPRSDQFHIMREPGPNCDLVIAYQGSVAPEAIRTAGILGERCRDIGVLAVTSADRLNAGWSAAQVARASGQRDAQSHADRVLGGLPAHCQIVTVINGHPATLAWIGGITRHRILPLGVEHFGQTGRIGDLYRSCSIDTDGIVARVRSEVLRRGTW